MTVIERPISDKVERLSTASARRVIEPDTDLPGHIGPGQIIPDDLLSVAGLDLDLTDEQKVQLSREEVGSITTSGVIFEAVLEAGFALQITRATDLTDPRGHVPAARGGGGDPAPADVHPHAGGPAPHRRPPARPVVAAGRPALRDRPLHPEAGAALHARAGRRGDPRPHPEEGGGAPGHRPVHQGGEPVPPPGGGPAPVLRPGRAARGVVDRRPHRPVPRPPGRPARDRRHVRHARAPRRLRDGGPARLGHLEGRQGLEAPRSSCATRPPGPCSAPSSTPVPCRPAASPAPGAPSAASTAPATPADPDAARNRNGAFGGVRSPGERWGGGGSGEADRRGGAAADGRGDRPVLVGARRATSRCWPRPACSACTGRDRTAVRARRPPRCGPCSGCSAAPAASRPSCGPSTRARSRCWPTRRTRPCATTGCPASAGATWSAVPPSPTCAGPGRPRSWPRPTATAGGSTARRRGPARGVGPACTRSPPSPSDGDVLWCLVDGKEQRGLSVSDPLALAVLQATTTVRMRFDAFGVREERVLLQLPPDLWWSIDDVTATRLNPAVLGVVDTALALLREAEGTGGLAEDVAEVLANELGLVRRARRGAGRQRRGRHGRPGRAGPKPVVGPRPRAAGHRRPPGDVRGRRASSSATRRSGSCGRPPSTPCRPRRRPAATPRCGGCSSPPHRRWRPPAERAPGGGAGPQ